MDWSLKVCSCFMLTCATCGGLDNRRWQEFQTWYSNSLKIMYPEKKGKTVASTTFWENTAWVLNSLSAPFTIMSWVILGIFVVIFLGLYTWVPGLRFPIHYSILSLLGPFLFQGVSWIHDGDDDDDDKVKTSAKLGINWRWF